MVNKTMGKIKFRFKGELTQLSYEYLCNDQESPIYHFAIHKQYKLPYAKSD